MQRLSPLAAVAPVVHINDPAARHFVADILCSPALEWLLCKDPAWWMSPSFDLIKDFAWWMSPSFDLSVPCE